MATLNTITPQLRLAALDLTTQAPALVDQIKRDVRLVNLGTLVAATQLVLLCWFALFLAVRHTSEERRQDIGLLKIRGASTWRIWTLTAQQSALPMVLGTVLGWALGYLAVAAMAGDLLLPSRTRDTPVSTSLWLSVAAAVLGCLGALVAAVVAEWRALRSPVVALLRRVPPRHRGWRAEVVDLIVVLLAVAGVYQGYAELRSDGVPSALALLAPGLVGLAVALLVARALPWFASSAGAGAIRGGRPGVALAALHLGRRPGTHRVFAVLAVAMAIFSATVLIWQTASNAWSQRAAQELGAARVLTVRAENSTMLLNAVRDADPSGQYAMAVARTGGSRPEERMLALDSTRLAVVAAPLAGGDGVGDGVGDGLGDLTALAARLRPPVAASLAVADGPVTVDISRPSRRSGDGTVGLRLNLSTPDGKAVVLDLGEIRTGRRAYEATVDGCRPACRLVSLEIVAPEVIARGEPATFDVFRISQGGSDVASAEVLGDVTRWRPPVGAAGVGNVVSANGKRLRLSLFGGTPAAGQRVDPRVFVADAPTTLPVLLAGARSEPERAGEARVNALGSDRVPFRVIGTTATLPRVGASGVLADLEYAQRDVDRAVEAVALEVWLTDSAPADIVERLRSSGVEVIQEETATGRRDGLASSGPGFAVRFQLFTAVIILLLAAGTVIVTAAVERRPRAVELSSMRNQGLTDRAMRVAAYAGPAALVLGGVVAGLLAAVVSRLVVTASMPIFADAASAPPDPRQALTVTVAGLIGVLALGLASVVTSARVVRAVRRNGSGEPA